MLRLNNHIEEKFEEIFKESKKIDRKKRMREAWGVSSKFDPTIYSKEEIGDTSDLIPAEIRALFKE